MININDFTVAVETSAELKSVLYYKSYEETLKDSVSNIRKKE